MLLVSNPVVVNEINSKHGVVGYKVEPWLKTTTDDMFFVNLNDVLTMSESSDIEMIMMYQNYVRQSNREGNYTKIDRKMGYLGNVNDTKELLEKIYKDSKNTKKPKSFLSNSTKLFYLYFEYCQVLTCHYCLKMI